MVCQQWPHLFMLQRVRTCPSVLIHASCCVLCPSDCWLRLLVSVVCLFCPATSHLHLGTPKQPVYEVMGSTRYDPCYKKGVWICAPGMNGLCDNAMWQTRACWHMAYLCCFWWSHHDI